MSEPILQEGWWFALNARKAHFYDEGKVTSICGKQMTLGRRLGTENSNHDSADNCAECKRRRTKPRNRVVR